VANVQLIHTLSDLGVILLMFALGLELRLSTLARVGVGAGLTALFEVTLVLTIGALVAGMLGFGAGEAVFAGACLAISSTMLVAKAFEEHRWKGGFTEVVFAILVFEDLIAIMLLALLTGFVSGRGMGAHDFVITIGKLAGFLAITLVVGLLAVPRLLRFVAKAGRKETLLIVALGICFGLAIVTEYFSYPVALGAFVAGLVVAESGLDHEVTELVRPFRDVFGMMFFVSIGMQIEPAQLADNILEILLFSAVVLIGKPLGVGLGTFAAGRGIQPAIRSGISLAQIGELSFVIAGLGIAAHAARPSLLAIAVGVTCITTLTSAILIKQSDAIARTVAAGLPGRVGTFVSFYEAWIGRLRGRERATWRRVRRPVYVLIADVLIIIAIIIGGSIAGGRVATFIGIEDIPARVVITVLGLAAISPFAIGVIRRVAQISRLLSLIIIPERRTTGHPGADAVELGFDLGRAPRRALMLMLELTISTVIAVPTIAAVQPFIGTSGLIAGAVLLVLITITYRSIVDFTQHVRAGSELILELMHHPPGNDAKQPLGHIEAMLPGFGGLVSVTLAPSSPAVGQSLAALDLRARTGATVLAIARGQGGFATPEPTEPLRGGDVLALTGSDDALAAARAALG
ncbi:MAG TPA: cation:proton antiporter, partial [Kofleriaceae bacterium]|nr:cation:proton antiporter [Kofleriaceae bacterium]